MSERLRPYTLAGHDVALAASRPKGRVLVVYLDRGGRPTDRFREVEPIELRRIGAHLADLKREIERLPEAAFGWEPRAVLCGARYAPLYVDHAIPSTDR